MPPRCRLEHAAIAGLLAVALLAPICSASELALSRARIEEYNALSKTPLPPLSDEHGEELLAREVVKQKWNTEVAVADGEADKDMRIRGVGYRIVDSPRLETWLAALDPHTLFPGRVKEYRVVDGGGGSNQLYQHMSLPWPIRDRNWVIDTWLDSDLAARSADRIWQQAWLLSENGREIASEVVRGGKVAGLDEDAAEKAVYLPANEGSWVVAQLDDDTTLLVYQLTIVVGGWIPESLGMKLAMRELDDTLNKVAAAAAGMQSHYVAGHETQFAGDRSVVRRFDEMPPSVDSRLDAAGLEVSAMPESTAAISDSTAAPETELAPAR